MAFFVNVFLIAERFWFEDGFVTKCRMLATAFRVFSTNAECLRPLRPPTPASKSPPTAKSPPPSRQTKVAEETSISLPERRAQENVEEEVEGTVEADANAEQGAETPGIMPERGSVESDKK